MFNLYEEFRHLVPAPPLQVGQVVDVLSGAVIVQLPDGGQIIARGSASLGQNVYVRDEVIEGQAPTLPIEIIDI